VVYEEDEEKAWVLHDEKKAWVLHDEKACENVFPALMWHP
jgi:hypothetical protein